MKLGIGIGVGSNKVTGGGSASGTNLGWDDLSTTIVVSGSNDEIATNPSTTNLSQYVKSNTGHSTGYHKFEILFIEQGNTTSQMAIGCVQGSPAQTWLGNNAAMLGLWGFSSSGNLYNNGSTISSNASQVIREDFLVSVYVRDGQRVWIEVHDTVGTTFNYMIGGGDPETDTTPTFTFGSAGTIYAAVTPYGNATEQTSASLHTTLDEFQFPARGASQWDD